ncbi:MAG: hypothetical protein PVG32_04995 [Anaerolineales bacterium]|jgi:dihydroorotate dehydrogenase electron transfer subunit
MRTGLGEVLEIYADTDRRFRARISCPQALIPAPGQYVLAYGSEVGGDVIAHSLFPGYQYKKTKSTPVNAFQTAMPVPPTWLPGTKLNMRGPMGNGFQLPENIHRLALIAFGQTVSCLLPLIPQVLQAGGDIALFSSTPLAQLPSAVEIHPLEALSDSLSWADFIVIALQWQNLSTLREVPGLNADQYLGIGSQILIHAPMPCNGIADCGVCALPAPRGYKLICRDGPVFDLKELEL